MGTMRFGLGVLLGLGVCHSFADVPSGLLFGKPFQPNHFTIKVMPPATASLGGKITDRAQGYILNMQVGNDFIPEHNIEIWWNGEMGRGLDSVVIDWQPTQFGSEAHSKQSFPIKGKPATVGRGITGVFLASGKKHEAFSDRIRCYLAFGSRKGDKIPVSVSVALPNATHFRGKFWATFEKT